MGAIKISHLTFTYRNYNKCNLVLHDLNLQINDGEFVCLIGHSGCGKTTLLNILAGLLVPKKGDVLIDGKPLTGPGIDRAVVFQHYSLFPWMTAEKNVLFGIQQSRKELNKQKSKELAKMYLKKVGMEKSMNKFPYELSGGMQQRVAIARALAMDAEILLLDEPFGSLDAKIREELQLLLENLWNAGKKRKTVIFVTHDIEEAILLADRIVFMRHGKIGAEFTVPYKRPRNREEILKSKDYENLKSKLLELFYLDSEVCENENIS